MDETSDILETALQDMARAVRKVAALQGADPLGLLDVINVEDEVRDRIIDQEQGAPQ